MLKNKKYFIFAFLTGIILFGLIYSFIKCDKEKKPKYIIIFLAGALRADHMGCYGYDKNTTPFIDKVAKQGLIYKNAFTTGDWTHPAVASLFTGLYLFQHKTTHVFKIKNTDRWKADVLDEKYITL